MLVGLAWWIGHVAFWMLLAYGWTWDEIGRTGAGVFLALWVAGYLGLPYLPFGSGFFLSYVAVLDVVLVFVVFKGDIPLS